MAVESGYPKCEKCGKGQLVPLSDFSNNQVSITYKAWACTNSQCRLVIVLRGGNVYYCTGNFETER